MPEVSVLIPVYNCESYLEQALVSILAQSFRDFEVICVDDGSRDKSLEILRNFEARDSRVRILSRANTGIVGALNDALALAQGALIARMDGDDVALPERFARQVEYMSKNPDCIALGTRVRLIDPEGDPLRLWSTETEHKAIDREHMSGRGGAITHPSAMIRRSALESLGGYRNQCNLAEDLDLFLRLAELGRIENLPEVLLEWRMHLSSTGATKREQQRAAASLAVREAHERRGLALSSMPSLAAQPECQEFEILRTWAWWALGAKEVKSARKLALKSFRRRPFGREQLRLLVCAARGY